MQQRAVALGRKLDALALVVREVAGHPLADVVVGHAEGYPCGLHGRPCKDAGVDETLAERRGEVHGAEDGAALDAHAGDAAEGRRDVIWQRCGEGEVCGLHVKPVSLRRRF